MKPFSLCIFTVVVVFTAVPHAAHGCTLQDMIGGCLDTVSNCQNYTTQCSDPKYFAVMYTHCKCQCNLCSLCQDVAPQCPCWANKGFCTNPFFQNQRHLCDKTCGFCDKSTTARAASSTTSASSTASSTTASSSSTASISTSTTPAFKRFDQDIACKMPKIIPPHDV